MDLVEQSVKYVSVIFEECLQEVYKGYYQDTKFQILVSYPKSINSFYEFRSHLHLKVLSGSGDQDELNYKVSESRQPVIDCVNKKLQSYKIDDLSHPGLSYSAVFAHNPSLKDLQPKPFDLDKTEFFLHIETALKRNFYAKIYNIKDVINRIIYVDIMLELITDMDIRDLISYIYRQYEKSQLDEFVNEYGQEIIDYIREIIDKL